MKRWPSRPLRDLCCLINEHAQEGSTPYLEIGNVNPKTKEYEVSNKPAVKGAVFAEEGDVIISRVRPTRGAVVLVREKRLAISSAFTVLRPRHEVERKYIFFALAWNNTYLSYLGSHSKGALYPTVPEKDVIAFEVPAPPPAEQKRIVGFLDEADELRKLRARADRRTAELIPALFHEMFGDLISHPGVGPIKELRQLGRVVTGGTPPSTKEGMFGGKIPFITPGDLQVNTRSPARFLTEAGVGEVRTVRAGSTLVCCIGATIGKTDRTWERSAFNQQINAIEWGEQIDDDFGLICMKQCSKLVIQQGNQTALPILKKSLFERIRIPVPALPLQKKFADLVSKVRELEAAQAANRLRLEALFQSLLHDAFAGDL